MDGSDSEVEDVDPLVAAVEAAKKAAQSQPQTTATSQAPAPPKRKLVTQPRIRSKRVRGPEASVEVTSLTVKVGKLQTLTGL